MNLDGGAGITFSADHLRCGRLNGQPSTTKLFTERPTYVLMPINVTCPSCHSRFQVSDKFAGKTGPCPKCKEPLKVPEQSEQVVIHAPADDSPKDSTGKSILKPIERKETKVSVPMIVGIACAAIVVPITAYMISRGFETNTDGVVQAPLWILGVGAVVLAFPLVIAGYNILRDDELAPYTGQALMIRAAICSGIYALLWGLHLYMHNFLYHEPIELYEVLIALPVLFIPGALAAMALLDLDGTSAALHYGFYLLVTVGLRLLMGLPAL